MWENAPNAFITVRSSKSLRPLRALQTLTTTERKKAKISNEDDFFIHKRRFFLILVLLSSFRRCWSVFLFHHSKKKKKKFVRERETWQQKKERDFRFSLKRHTHTKITHHHTSQQEFFLLCDFQRHFSATPLFVSEIKRQKKQRRQFLFLLFETRFTRVSSSIVNTISIFIQRTTSGERFFL